MENKESLNQEQYRQAKIEFFHADVKKLMDWRDAIADYEEWEEVYSSVSRKIREVVDDGPNYVTFT